MLAKIKEAHFEALLPNSNSVVVELNELRLICGRTWSISSFDGRILNTVTNDAPFRGPEALVLFEHTVVHDYVIIPQSVLTT
jgi:hypothetical protein